MFLSIIVPVFNEEESLKQLYQEITEVISRDFAGKPYEVIFVNDGSTDESGEVLRKIKKADEHIRVLSLRRNSGKAVALREGFAFASGQLIVTMDADLQDDPANIPLLKSELTKGYDMVVGWKKERKDPLNKTIPSKVFNFLVRRLSKLELHDFNSGLKIMKKPIAKQLILYGELHRFIPLLAHKNGFRVGEIAVSHRPREYGVSKYGNSRFQQGFLDLITVMFLITYATKPMHLFGSIGLISLSIGLCLGVYLSILRFLGQSIGNRPLLTLAVLLVIAGIQSFSTGLIAELLVNRTSRSIEEDELE